MSEVKTPEAPLKSPKEAITYFEERLKRARLRLAQAKKELHQQSIRERSRRERDIGKIVWRLIEDGKLEQSVIALLRDEVRAACRSPEQVSAFRGTLLGE
jgi:phosphoenolpyruvate-protein kinase (PTS system EI component)